MSTTHAFSLKRRLLQLLPPLARREPILVFIHDGWRLQGLLLDPRRDYALLTRASSEALQFAHAVDDIVTMLGHVPTRAVLATPTCILTLLDLPLPSAPSSADMLGLVRWELEPLHAEQAPLWCLGNILVGRGTLTREQRQALVTELAERRAGVGTFTPLRLGELAVEWGYAEREDIEAALAQQQQLVMPDEHVVCAWMATGATPASGPEVGTPGWLASAIGLTLLGRWVAACERHDIRLEGIVPLSGTVAICAPPPSGLLLELHATAVTLTRHNAGRVVSQVQRTPGDHELLTVALDVLHEHLLPTDRELCWLATVPAATELAESLALATDRVLKPLSPDPVHEIAMAAARRAADASLVLPLITGSEPPPPLWQRFEVWVTVACLVLIVVMGGYEAMAVWRQQWLEHDARTLHATVAQISQSKARLAQGQDEARKADSEREKIEGEVTALKAELDFYERQLGQRQQFVMQTLTALAGSANAEVLVESLDETSWFEFDIKAWAMSQEGAYRFARDLALALEPWHMQVSDITLKDKPGRTGQAGFDVSFQLLRKAPTVTSAVAGIAGAAP